MTNVAMAAFRPVIILAMASFPPLICFKMRAKRNDTSDRGLKTCEDWELKHGGIGIRIIFNI